MFIWLVLPPCSHSFFVSISLKPISASICFFPPLVCSEKLLSDDLHDLKNFDNMKTRDHICLLPSHILAAKCQAISYVAVWLCTRNPILKIVVAYLLSWIVTEAMTHKNECDTDSVPQWCQAHCMHCSPVGAPGKDSERRNATHSLEFPNVIDLDSLWKSNWIFEISTLQL